MKTWKPLILLGTLGAVILAVVALGSGDDDRAEARIRTGRGLDVAAAGAGFDPRLQNAGSEGDQAGGVGAPTSGIAGTDIAKGGAGFAPNFAPVLQQGGAGITVQGWGTATADADSAVLDFYFYRSGPVGTEPSPPPYPDASSSRGSSGSAGIAVGEPAPPSGADVDLQEVAPITEADLQPVIDALVAAGVARDKIEFIGQPYFDKYSASASLRATVDDVSAVDAAVTAAAGVTLGDIQFSGNNVMYTVTDCAALEKAAMVEAVADAGERGAVFAEALGVGLGDVIGAANYSYSAYGENTCGGAFGGPYPLYDAVGGSSGGGQVQVFANISVTYALQ
jgi:uncharacterized protein YggE